MSLHESYRVTRPDTLRPPLIEAVCKSARSVGTPFWLYETEPMRQRVRQLRAFDCIRFAQKANSNIHILRILRATGVLVDAVSLGEIERALRAGYRFPTVRATRKSTQGNIMPPGTRPGSKLNSSSVARSGWRSSRVDTLPAMRAFLLPRYARSRG